MALPDGPRSLRAVQLAQWIQHPMQFLDECYARYGDVFTVRLAFAPALVVISDPDLIRQVFSGPQDDLHAGEANIVLRPFLGQHSVLQLDGAEHLRHRRLLLPPFHGERMQAYGSEMLTITERTVDAWPVGKAFPVHPSMQSITLQVILRTVFGLREGSRFEQLANLLREGLEIAAWPPLLLPAMQFDWGRFSPWGRFQRITSQVDELLLEEIRQRRGEDTLGRTDVLSMLLAARDEAGQPLSEAELRDELITMLVAGHETTATGLSWALRWLLETPDVMARLVAEIATARVDGKLMPERVARLELLDATVRETLRLQPVIPMVGRVVKKPMKLGAYTLPAGSVVAPSIYLAHRRARTFSDPRRFDPDRFLRTKPGPNEWFPFGGGIRRCIGMAFALYEMKMVLASVLSRVTLARAGKPTRVVRRAITLAPSEGLPVVVLDRTEHDAARSAA